MIIQNGNMLDMDTLDHRLIGLLRENARATVLELAQALGVARATVQNRMRRLERDGVILGYTVRLQAPGALAPIRALMSILVEGDGDALIPQIQAEPAVRMLHTTNGRWDLIAEIETETLADFDRVLRRIRTIPGVANSETSLLLSSRAF
jgi:DNA-binding Lrp family transcriptional regulator